MVGLFQTKMPVRLSGLLAVLCLWSPVAARSPLGSEDESTPPTAIVTTTLDACIAGSRTRYLPVDPEQVAPSCNLAFVGPTAYACRWKYMYLFVDAPGPISVGVASAEFDPVAYLCCSVYDVPPRCIAFDDDDGVGVSSLIDLPAGLPVGLYFLCVFGYGPLDSGCFTVETSANVDVTLPGLPVATESTSWSALKTSYR